MASEPNEPVDAESREIAVGGDGKSPILDAVTGEPIRVPADASRRDSRTSPRRASRA